jgi:aminocarboxymuconate-semialdehyde decarboxylase
MIVDCQAHWYPRAYFGELAKRVDYPTATRVNGGFVYEPRAGERWQLGARFVDLDFQLEDAAANGTDLIVISPAVFGDVTDRPLEEAVATARMLNDEFAQAQRAYPSRVLSLAVLPMQDPAAAIEELDRAAGELGLRAVCLHSSIAGGRIGKEPSWPVYERMVELGLPIFLHPTRSFAADDLKDGGFDNAVGLMLDSTIGALSLIYDGVLDRLPELRVVHPHLGGVLPYLLGRIEEEDRKPWAGRRAERAASDYLRDQFWTDTVSRVPQALELARATYGPERLLFSSDYPYWDRADGLAFVREHLPKDEVERVLGANAAELLGLEAEVTA